MFKRDIIVSVIIPTYNSSGSLKLSLQTVLWQDFTDFEVWVVGDGCTDDSENVVTSFADDRVHWMNLPSNSGSPSMPRNEGLRRSKGKFIAYLGHDDLWFPWHLSELVNCIETDNSDFVYSFGALLGPKGVIGTFTLPKRPWSLSENISPSNWLHKKRLVDVIGSWSTDEKIGEDREFLHRVLSANITPHFWKKFSVLKFPSVIWSNYSLKTFPQTSYVKAIRKNTATLSEELLLELAILKSRRGHIYEHRNPLYRFLRLLANFYGCNRWPVNRLLLRRWRRGSGL